MKPEHHRTHRAFGNEQTLFAQPPARPGASETFQEPALKATGQEISDLYALLRDKCSRIAPRVTGLQL